MTRLNFLRIERDTIYILPFLILLATDPLFHPFIYGTKVGFALAYGEIIGLVEKLTGLAAVGLLLLNVNKFRGNLLFIYILSFIYLAVLIFESLYLYNNFMRYPHVILKFFNLFIALALFSYYSGRHTTNFHLAMNFIILGLLMKIVIQPEMLSLQAFVSHERGLPAGSVFLLVLPCIYFFNQYLTTLKTISLLKFLFVLLFIFIANHRTVWVTITFSLLVSLFLIRNNIHFRIGKVLQTIIVVALLSGYILAIAISYNPSVGEKITANITNILNPTEDDTGSWRLLQMKSYWPVVEKNFLTGMRWKGFELPIQFYHPEAGIAYFDDGTGHHFHSFYFDTLFYFGILGVMFFLFIMVLPMFYILKHRLTLNNIQLSFFIFSISGLVYGISYFLPFSYWIIFGVTLMQVNVAFQNKNNQTISTEIKISDHKGSI